LKLHQRLAAAGAAIDAQLMEFLARVGVHGIEQVGDSEGDAFERGAGEVRAAVVPRVMPSTAPRRRRPNGAEPRECGDEDDARRCRGTDAAS
jgi:hypothetical protein